MARAPDPTETNQPPAQDRIVLLLAMGLFLVHALINIAHRPGWLSIDVAPHWFTVGCAIYDVYLAGLCFFVWRR